MPTSPVRTSRQETKTFAAAKSPVHQEWEAATENMQIPMTLYPRPAPRSSTSTEQSPRHDERENRHTLLFRFHPQQLSRAPESQFTHRVPCRHHASAAPSEKQRDRRTRRNEPSNLGRKVSGGAARDLHDGGNLPHELIRRNGLAIRQHVLLRNLASLGYQYPRVRPHTCQQQSKARTLRSKCTASMKTGK